MGNERLTLEIASQATGQDSIDRLTTAINRYATAAEAAGNRGSSGFNATKQAVQQAGDAAEQSVVKWNKLAFALKDVAEGRKGFAGVEAGYFIQSLGSTATLATAAAVGVGALAYAIYRINETVREGGPKMAQAFDGLTGSLRTSNDELRVTNDRLSNDIAKLEGRPQNTLALSLDEARVNADKLAESIGKDVQALDELLHKQGFGRLNAIFTKRNPTTEDEDYIRKFSVGLQQIDRAGLANVRAAKDEASRKKAQEEWNTAALGLIDSGTRQMGQRVEQSQMLEKLYRQGFTSDEFKAYTKRFGAVPTTATDETSRLSERLGTLQDLTELRDKYTLTTSNNSLQSQDDKDKANKELADSRNRERLKDSEDWKRYMDSELSYLKQDHDVTNDEETAFWTKQLQAVQLYGGRYIELYDEILKKLGDLGKQRSEMSRRVANGLGAGVIEVFDRIAREMDNLQKQQDEFVAKDATAGTQTAQFILQSQSNLRLAGLNMQRAAFQRAAALLPPGSSQADQVSSQLALSKKLTEIDQQTANERIRYETDVLNHMHADNAEEIKAKQEQADKIVEIQTQANKQIYDDTTRTLELIHSEQEKQVESFRNFSGSLFTAIADRGRNPMAMRDLMRSTVMGFGQTIFENAATQFIYPTLQKATSTLHTTAGSTLGKVFSGTPFGPDPLRVATDANTLATQDNTAALSRLAMSPTGGGGGLPSAAGIAGTASYGTVDGSGVPIAGGDGLPLATGSYGASAGAAALSTAIAPKAPSSLASSFGNFSADSSTNGTAGPGVFTGSLGTDAMGNSIPDIGAGSIGAANIPGGLASLSAAMSPKSLSSVASGFGNFSAGASSVFSGNALSILLGENTTGPTTLSGQIGAGVGLAGALGAGTYGIISGLNQGGVGGDLKAAGSAAGTAGMLVGNISKLLGAASPLLSAIPIVGSIAAAVLPLIGGFFNGPQQRANQINTELGSAQYVAPVALNSSMSTGGTFADFNYKGGLRTSNFSPYPQVRQGYVWEQTHGIFGGPPTFYDVTGGQTSQFGAPVAPQPPTVINISAIDTQSFADAVQKNHMAIGSAAATALQNAHGTFSREVARAGRYS